MSLLYAHSVAYSRSWTIPAGLLRTDVSHGDVLLLWNSVLEAVTFTVTRKRLAHHAEEPREVSAVFPLAHKVYRNT